MCRPMEGSWSQDTHDRNADSPTVVHLRLGEGGVPAATPTSTRYAREPQEKATGQAGDTVRGVARRVCGHPPHTYVAGNRCYLLLVCNININN